MKGFDNGNLNRSILFYTYTHYWARRIDVQSLPNTGTDGTIWTWQQAASVITKHGRVMMSVTSVKEQVTKSLDSLSETELQQVAEYVAFLKFRARVAPLRMVDGAQLAALYAQCADEDRALAEEGLAWYRDQLHAEDTK